MKRLIAVLIILSASTLFGQETARPTILVGEKQVTKVITLKYGNRIHPSDIALLDGLMLRSVNRSGDLVVATGTQERVDMAESILKQLDVPPPPPPPVVPKKNIQVTPYLIIASSSAPAVPGQPLPKDLESAVAQVSSVFPYKSFNLFDAIVMRVTDGSGGTVQGILPTTAFRSGGNYSLLVDRIMLQPTGEMLLNNFSLTVFIANGVDKDGKDKFQTVRLATSYVDIKDGQKVVVGKANIDGSSNALIVILTAKVVD